MPRRVQQIIRKYADLANIERSVHPHLLRHQMLTFLTAQGLTDAKYSSSPGTATEKALSFINTFHLQLSKVIKLFAI